MSRTTTPRQETRRTQHSFLKNPATSIIVLSCLLDECASFHFANVFHTSITGAKILSRNPRFMSEETFLPAESWQDNPDWKPGDVYRDLYLLEQAIAYTNAQQDLEHKERVETLNYMAAKRRPLQGDMQNNCVTPLLASLVLTSLYKAPNPITRRLAQWIAFVYDAHFWAIVVAAPILLLLLFPSRSNNRSQPLQSSPEPPPELKGLDPEYLRFVTTTDDDWEDPSISMSSCRDYVKCLLEQWVSAVAGMALAGPFFPRRYRQHLGVLTRLAAFLSMRQFPKLWFELTRAGQPRPIPRSVWAVQQLAAFQLFPWALVPGISRLLSGHSWTTIGFIYATLAAGVCAILIHPKLLSGEQQRLVPRSPVLWIACLLWLGPQYPTFMEATRPIVHALKSRSLVAVLRSSALKRMGTAIALAIASVGPIAHLVALRSIVRVSKTHDLSLSLGTEDFSQQLHGAQERKDCIQWRWRLVWREPRRIQAVLQQYWEGFWYWLFFSGSVQEKLRKEFRSKKQSEVHRQGFTVLQQVARERAQNPDLQLPDRAQWKKEAMDRLADKHEREYEQGSFDDALGVAVQKTFGIGLGFNFDHSSDLLENESPSSRRLQARAAKSAIVRAKEIYNASSTRAELDTIEDPIERSRRALEMRKHADEEIRFLAERLTELVPTDLSLDDRRTTRVEQFAPNNNDYVKTSANEFVLRRPRDRSSAVQKLMDDYISNLEHSGNTYSNTSENTKDDQFIEEWASRQYSTNMGGDDDENKIEIALA